MARKRSGGNFYKNGRRKQPTTKAAREDASRVLPTPETMNRIDRRKAYWTHHMMHGGKAGDHCFDNAGVLWASGWFAGHGFEPDIIRDEFRKYAALYHRWYIETAPKIAKHERVSRATLPTDKEGWERLFMKLDERLPLGDERKAVHRVCIDGWFFDELDPQVMRLANTGRLLINARLQPKPPLEIVGYLELPGDREWLATALRGIFRLIDADLPQRGVMNDIAFWTMSEAA
jgi:hypothetical protein